MNKPIDYPIMVCVYCGNTMNGLTKEQEKRFGRPNCCEYDMLAIDGNKLHTIVRAFDKLKSSLEKQILEGMM